MVGRSHAECREAPGLRPPGGGDTVISKYQKDGDRCSSTRQDGPLWGQMQTGWRQMRQHRAAAAYGHEGVHRKRLSRAAFSGAGRRVEDVVLPLSPAGVREWKPFSPRIFRSIKCVPVAHRTTMMADLIWHTAYPHMNPKELCFAGSARCPPPFRNDPAQHSGMISPGGDEASSGSDTVCLSA
jgi:hypothetical protein